MEYIKQIRTQISELKGSSQLSFWNSDLLNNNILINECVNERNIEELEKKYSVKLPVGYRDYLLNIGNGGNQPGVGMLTVQQSLALLFSDTVESFSIAISDLTQYYKTLNLHDQNDLLKYYFQVFDGCSDINTQYPEFDDLEGYFTEEGLFIYRKHYKEDFDVFLSYESAMKKHLLIFSYDDECRIVYALAMDGKHKDQVVYYSCESKGTVMKGRDIVFTNMSFLEWMVALYKNSCDPFLVIKS